MTRVKERTKKFTYVPKKKAGKNKVASAETCDIIAYDIDAKKEVFHWRDVTLKKFGAFYTRGNTIEHGPNSWFIEGERVTSTVRVKRIDVRKVNIPAESKKAV
jgi:hypothetical protein